MKRIFLLLFLFTTLISEASAQFYSYGQDRATIKWSEWKSDGIELIYPEFYSARAEIMAGYFELLHRTENSLQHTPRRIPIVLHADGGVSNGVVAWAPFTADLYTLPPQDPGDLWLWHLSSHEFRHIIQMDKVNQHATHILYYIFGELSPTVVMGAYIPFWFLEGDAVAYETSLGRLGRGRSPEFINEMKAQILEKGLYSYDKAVLGSYKDFVPNRYTLGYFMTSMARIHYGNDVWANALRRTARRPVGITPFTTSLKMSMEPKRDSLWSTPRMAELFDSPEEIKEQNTHPNSRRTLYEDIFGELCAEWERTLPEESAGLELIPTENRSYMGYYSPIEIGEDSVVAYKYGLSESGAIVLLTNGEEKRLTKVGYLEDYKLAVSGSKILWSEYKYDLRWQEGDRLQLCTYDIAKGRFHRYRSEKNRYAVFSGEGMWGCVEITPEGHSDILLLNEEMEEILRIYGEDGELFIHPSMSGDRIFTVVQNERGNKIVAFDLGSEMRYDITPEYEYEVDNPIYEDGALYFRASFNNNNAIYRLNNNNLEMVAESRYGTIAPSIGRERLLFSSYTADGYKPASIPKDSLNPTPAEFKRFYIADRITELEHFPVEEISKPHTLNDSLGESSIENRRYRKFVHLPYFHSWGPIYANADDMDVRIGATAYSQNPLGTLSLTAGYILLDDYPRGACFINATYSAWRPIISLRGEFGKQHLTATGPDGNKYKFLPYYKKLQVMVQMPFRFSRREWITSLTPFVSYNLEGYSSDDVPYNSPIGGLPDEPTENLKLRLVGTTDYYVRFGMTFRNRSSMTSQELNPRWEQSAGIGYALDLDRDGTLGDTWYGYTGLCFPGFATNHSISLYAGYQKMSNDSISGYNTLIRKPRGIDLKACEYTTLRCSYTLPLWYPDGKIGSVLYFSRLYGTLFYDWGEFGYRKEKHRYFSSGVELATDFNALRLTYPLTIGLRTGYESRSKGGFAELLFSVTFSL